MQHLFQDAHPLWISPVTMSISEPFFACLHFERECNRTAHPLSLLYTFRENSSLTYHFPVAPDCTNILDIKEEQYPVPHQLPYGRSIRIHKRSGDYFYGQKASKQPVPGSSGAHIRGRKSLVTLSPQLSFSLTGN